MWKMLRVMCTAISETIDDNVTQVALHCGVRPLKLPFNM